MDGAGRVCRGYGGAYRLTDGDTVPFDLCSLAVGSVVARGATPGVGEVMRLVKPLE